MDFGSINWLAVVACVVVSMVSGSLWYNPRTFFPVWWKVVGKEGEVPGMQNMGMTWTLTVLSSFVQAVAMSLMVTAMGSPGRRRNACFRCAGWFHALARLYRAHVPGQ